MSGDRQHVLVVDDNKGQRDSVSLVLRHLGHEVSVAAGGYDALSLIEAKPFDLILMDLRMPKMNGLEVLERIRKLPSDVVVVLMTAYAFDDLSNRAFTLGARTVLSKPVDPRELAEVIQAEKTGTPTRILIVDDEESAALMLKRVLEQRGFDVQTAKTAEEAVEMSACRHYHIGLLDMKLPAGDGVEAYLGIRKSNPEFVGIMITGFPEETTERMQMAMRNDSYACITKPIDLKLLLRIIEEKRKHYGEDV